MASMQPLFRSSRNPSRGEAKAALETNEWDSVTFFGCTVYKMCYGIFYKNLNLEISIPLSKYFDLSVNTFVKTLKHQYH